MNKLYITSATGFEIYERIIHQSAYQAIWKAKESNTDYLCEITIFINPGNQK